MHIRIRHKLTFPTSSFSPRFSLVSTLILACLLATAFSFSATRPALAEIPSTFKIPHEVQTSAMLVIDLDGDGKKEIITGSIDGYLTVVNGLSYQVIWDKNMADYLTGYSKTRIQSGLAAADLDGDGRMEIVVATGGADPTDSDGPGAIVVLTYVGGSDYLRLMQGWPVFALDELGNGAHPDGHPDGFISTPSLGDIDGDGKMEIVIGGMDRRLHAYHHDGSNVIGWPLAREYGILRESRSTAALADMDGDGILDIFIGSNNYSIPSCANPYIFYGIKGNTVPLPGFPFSTTQNIESSPALGDINHDGSLDIVFGTGDFNESCNKPGGQQSDGKKVYALDRFGHNLPGWPVTTNANMVNSPALGDLDIDGVPEVVIHTQDTLYAWHGNGSLVQGFPVHGDYNLRHASPVLADVDGDSQVEIVLASGQVYGPTGQLEQTRNKLQSQVVVIDQDGDGLLETIGANHFNYDKGLHLMVYIFHESGSTTSAQPWPMFHRSADRNGVLPILYTLSGRIVDESNKGVPNVKVTLNSGQTTFTDGQGNYIFGSLPPDDYTVTPDYQNNLFKPAQRLVTLAGNATVDPMVMHAPVYDIKGRVLQANGSPLAGVKVRLSTGATVTTAKDGSFTFNDQQPGKYTLTPLSPDLNYQPEQRTLTAQEEFTQIFYALPKPVVDVLQPNRTTQLSFNDTQGLPTQVIFPQGLGTGEAVLTPILADEPSGYISTGHAIKIALSNTDTSAQSGVVGQDGDPLSIEITIQYSTADLRSLSSAEELTLMWKSPDGWVDAQATCPAGNSADNNVATQTITVPVCQWGVYALVAPVDQLYLPNLHGNE
jgi:hypothetical protein